MGSEQQARALRDTVGVRWLEDERVVRVSGDDARSWLDGQVTNQIGVAAPGTAVYALIVNLNGKVMTDCWVLDRNDELWMLMPSNRVESILEYLDGYIVMEDVELEVLDSVVISVQGPRAGEAVERVEAAGDAAWPCARLGDEGRDVVVSRDEAQAVCDALVEAAESLDGGAVDEAGWELARLRLGRPQLGVDFGDWTLPQEAGLKQRAVSFTKGCYQGQEAVVMLEHRGKPPKKLTRFELEGDESPQASTPVYSEDGTSIGQITSAAVDPESPGTIPALGYLKRKHACEGMRVRVGDTQHGTARQILTD